jgi:hypothetical protein
MKMTALLFFALSVGCLLQAAEISPEARQCYEWFSTLGFPDVTEAKWAEVTQTYDSFHGDENGVKKLHGFIVSETGKDFSILLPDLTTKTMLRAVSNVEFQIRGTFEKRLFPAWAAEQLQALQNPPKDGFRRFGAHLGHKAEVFALSYFCWRRGEDDLAAQLYAEAQKLENRVLSWQEVKVVPNMREALEIGLGHASMWDAVLRMGGGSLSGNSWGGSGPLQPRTEVLEAFRRLVRLFPRCEHIERAKATIAMLERMVKEDAKHTALTQQQIDQLPLEKRIAELIWRLRDQNGHQMSQPGSCDVFGYFSEQTAAHQLLKIGYPAAPALIEALTDDRFSRSVGFHRNFYFSHTILTIGDCAQQILERLTGQDFYAPDSTSGYMSNEDKMLAVQKAARAWWATYEKKGLSQMLVDDISSGKKPPHPLVEQLKQADASAVETAVLAGAAKASEDWMTYQFIDEIASLKTPKATEALQKLMKSHAKTEVRLAAASRLFNQDHPDALPAILHEWSTYKPLSRGHDDVFDTMINILAGTGSDRAIQALASRWDASNASQRIQMIEAIGTRMRPEPVSGAHSTTKQRPLPAEARERGIELLVHALEDTQACYGMSGGRGDYNYSNPRICDHALWALHEVDGSQFTFSPKASRRLRESERISAANRWRKEHGKSLLPAPPPPGPKLPPADAVRIVRVRLLPEQPEAAEIAKKVQSLEGTRLAPETLPQLLVWFATSNLNTARGLDIEASRENDLTGVEILLRVHLGQPKAKESPDWQTHHSVSSGEKRLGNSSGSASHAYVIKPEHWEDFQDAARDALQQPPDTDFHLDLGLSRE